MPAAKETSPNVKSTFVNDYSLSQNGQSLGVGSTGAGLINSYSLSKQGAAPGISKSDNINSYSASKMGAMLGAGKGAI